MKNKWCAPVVSLFFENVFAATDSRAPFPLSASLSLTLNYVLLSLHASNPNPLQVGIFAFTFYFILAIRRRQNGRKILVPDVSQSQVFANNVPGPDELTYRETTYFQHEMTEVYCI